MGARGRRGRSADPPPTGTTPDERFDPWIVACYLYPITRYGYPPPAEHTERYVQELHALGFQSIELEGIHAQHLSHMHAISDDARRTAWRAGQRPAASLRLPG